MRVTMPGAPLGQHTVSRFILKGFRDKRGDVAAFERRTGRCRRVPFGSRMFETAFDAHDPGRSESLWGAVETRAGVVLARLKSTRELLDADHETLRELMAVHWARSRAMMTARAALTDRVVAESKLQTLATRPHLLAEAYLAKMGVMPNAIGQLAWINDLIHEQIVGESSAMWHSDRNPKNLSAAREIFAKSAVQIGIAPAGCEYALGDAPVIVMKPGHAGVGPHHGVALGDAEQIAMPVTPDMMLALGPTAGVIDMDADAVRWYNERQWDGFQQWIVARPEGGEEGRMRRESALEELRRQGKLPR